MTVSVRLDRYFERRRTTSARPPRATAPSVAGSGTTGPRLATTAGKVFRMLSVDAANSVAFVCMTSSVLLVPGAIGGTELQSQPTAPPDGWRSTVEGARPAPLMPTST